MVDLQGSGKGVMELRAAQLAQKGIAGLALAYQNETSKPDELDIDHFGNAVQYLLKQKEV